MTIWPSGCWHPVMKASTCCRTSGSASRAGSDLRWTTSNQRRQAIEQVADGVAQRPERADHVERSGVLGAHGLDGRACVLAGRFSGWEATGEDVDHRLAAVDAVQMGGVRGEDGGDPAGAAAQVE